MPTMTNAKTAPVLDSADAELAKLDWVLFKQEQDARLFASKTDEDDDWVPGDYLYDYPTIARFSEFTRPSPGIDSSYFDYDEDSYGTSGNHVRPMFQLFNDGERYRYVRCSDCDVDWAGDYPCFVCGEERESPKARFNFGGLYVDSDCPCIACQYRRGGITREEFVTPEFRMPSFDQRGSFVEFQDSIRSARQETLYNLVYTQADIQLVQQMISPMRDTFVSVMGEVAQTYDAYSGALRRAIVSTEGMRVSLGRTQAQVAQESEGLCPVFLGIDPADRDGSVIIAAIRDRNGVAYVLPEREVTRRTESPWGTAFVTTRRITVTDVITIPRVVDYEPVVPLPVMSAVRTELPDRRYPTSQPITQRRRERYDRSRLA